MASAGPNNAGTGADDSAVGTVAWTGPGNATGAQDATSDLDLAKIAYANSSGDISYFDIVKIVKGGSVVGNNKSDGSLITSGMYHTYKSFGGAADLWGTTWAYTDINSSTFGVVVSCRVNDAFPPQNFYTHYLKLTNFGFSIPDSTVDGIVVEYDIWTPAGYPNVPAVDDARITVYYTESASFLAKSFQVRQAVNRASRF